MRGCTVAMDAIDGTCAYSHNTVPQMNMRRQPRELCATQNHLACTKLQPSRNDTVRQMYGTSPLMYPMLGQANELPRTTRYGVTKRNRLATSQSQAQVQSFTNHARPELKSVRPAQADTFIHGCGAAKTRPPGRYKIVVPACAR